MHLEHREILAARLCLFQRKASLQIKGAAWLLARDVELGWHCRLLALLGYGRGYPRLFLRLPDAV